MLLDKSQPRHDELKVLLISFRHGTGCSPGATLPPLTRSTSASTSSISTRSSASSRATDTLRLPRTNTKAVGAPLNRTPVRQTLSLPDAHQRRNGHMVHHPASVLAADAFTTNSPHVGIAAAGTNTPTGTAIPYTQPRRRTRSPLHASTVGNPGGIDPQPSNPA